MTQSPEQTVLRVIRDAIRGTEFENQVFIAGGYVRDEILGRQSKDIDLVITREDGGIEFANWITDKFRCHTFGNPVLFPRFGTAKFHLRGTFDGVDVSDVQIEAVMPRSEVYIAGSRKPEVGFTSLEEDAKRRDFTINSLFKNVSTGAIHDFTGGREDIRRGIVRTAMDPDVIFADDPLRMLRALRFCARLGYVIDPILLVAIHENRHKLANISVERVQDEFSKMLLCQRPTLAIEALWLTKLLHFVVPELEQTVGLVQNAYHTDDVFDHTLAVLDDTPVNLVTRLTALFHDIGKIKTRTVDDDGSVHFYQHEEVGSDMAVEILRRLRYSTDVIDSVAKGVRNHMRLKQSGKNGELISDKALRKLRNDLGDDLEMILDVMHADNLAHHPDHVMPNQIPGVRSRLSALGDPPAKIKLPIDGNDVMQELGITPGPQVKLALEAVKDAWFENPQLSRDDALAIIKSL